MGEDGRPAAEWRVAYGFVPFVAIQHYNVGLPWGWSEMHPGQSRFREVDDLASKLHDQIRKTVSTAWLFAGVDAPKTTPRTTSRDSSLYQQTSTAGDRPEPGREEVPALYGPVGATAVPLVAPLDIEGVNATIGAQLEELEREYPELQMDIWTASGEASGRALRVARQRAESKVRMRRVGYDQALVRAQQMAVAIGGMRGYEGYSGFGLESYKAGDLDHSISKRPVFASDPADDAEIEMLFYQAANEAVKAGVPLEFYLQEHGWDKAKMKRLEEVLAEREQRETPAPAWNPNPPAGGEFETG
jgi:hypothetical protein